MTTTTTATNTNIVTVITIDDFRNGKKYSKTLRFKGFVTKDALNWRLGWAKGMIQYSNIPTEFKELVLAPSSYMLRGLNCIDVDIIYDADDAQLQQATATLDEIAKEYDAFCA